MTIGTLLGFILIGIGLQQHSANIAGLTSTCQNEATTEGETGQMHYSINPNIPIDDDPGVVIFIKRYQATGNIIRCRRPYNGQHVECKVSDHRFQSDGLIGSTISLRVPNATWSLQGHYELHVVANGTFHPTTSCYLGVHNKTGLNSEDRETINVVLIVVPIVICLLVSSSVLVVLVMLCIRRHERRQSCRSGYTDRIKSTTHLVGDRDTKSAHLLPDLDESGKSLRETIPSAFDVPKVSENLISLNNEEVPDEKESKDDADINIDEEVPSSSADKVKSGTHVSQGTVAIIGIMFSSSLSAAYSATLGKLINSNTEDERSEEPTETNGLLQNDQEPSVTKPPKKISKHCDFISTTTAGFNKRAKTQRQSEKREQNKVPSPRAGTSQSGQKGDVGMCAPPPVISSLKTTPYTNTNIQRFSYTRPKQPQKTTDDLHVNHHTTLETTL